MSATETYKRGPGRPAKVGGMDTWKIYIPLELSTFFRTILVDANTGRIPQGAMSGMIERLLREERTRVEAYLNKLTPEEKEKFNGLQ